MIKVEEILEFDEKEISLQMSKKCPLHYSKGRVDAMNLMEEGKEGYMSTLLGPLSLFHICINIYPSSNYITYLTQNRQK